MKVLWLKPIALSKRVGYRLATIGELADVANKLLGVDISIAQPAALITKKLYALVN